MILGTRPLCDWVIVLTGARNLLGKPVAGNTKLSPVYEFRTIVSPQTGIVRQVVSVLFYDVSELAYDILAPRIEVNSLPIKEVEILHAAVTACESAMIELRSHQTGLVSQPPKLLLPT